MNMRNILKSKAGFTLIELLIVTLVFGIVVAGALGFMTAQQNAFNKGSDQLLTLQNLRYAYQTLEIDLSTLGSTCRPDSRRWSSPRTTWSPSRGLHVESGERRIGRLHRSGRAHRHGSGAAHEDFDSQLVILLAGYALSSPGRHAEHGRVDHLLLRARHLDDA